MTVGTGISCCLVLGGRAYAGARGNAICFGAPPVEDAASGLAVAAAGGREWAEEVLRRPVARPRRRVGRRRARRRPRLARQRGRPGHGRDRRRPRAGRPLPRSRGGRDAADDLRRQLARRAGRAGRARRRRGRDRRGARRRAALGCRRQPRRESAMTPTEALQAICEAWNRLDNDALAESVRRGRRSSRTRCNERTLRGREDIRAVNAPGDGRAERVRGHARAPSSSAAISGCARACSARRSPTAARASTSRSRWRSSCATGASRGSPSTSTRRRSYERGRPGARARAALVHRAPVAVLRADARRGRARVHGLQPHLHADRLRARPARRVPGDHARA